MKILVKNNKHGVKLCIIALFTLTSNTVFAKCSTHLWVVLNDQGIATQVVNKDTSPNAEKTHNKKHIHKAKRNNTICWNAVKVNPKNSNKYIKANKAIDILWGPNQKQNWQKVAKVKISSKAPLGIEYKYSVATRKSNPKDASTYLDPIIIVIR
jgi:hypothetical protein